MKKRVVITGIGAITPIGNSVPEYFEALKAGKCGVDFISRFDVTDSKCKVAAEVKNFDPSACFDKLSRGKTDLYVQYAVCAAKEAVDDSGILGNIDADEFGVYVGSGVGGINTLCDEEAKMAKIGAKGVSPHFIAKMIINIAAGQIAIRFGAHGPALCVATACATGTTAIGEAYRAIRDGYMSAAICGGTEASVNSLAVAGFVNCMALSQANDPNEASLPFDSRRAGFVLGEGAAILILEEYEHAVARGAKIYAEVCGYGATCDAHHVTAPDPSAKQTTRAIAQAMEGVEYDGQKTLEVRKQTEEGYQIWEVQLPCLLTVLASANKARYMSVRGIVTAFDREVEIWSADDVQADPATLGLNGSPTRVKKSFTKGAKSAGKVFEVDANEAADLIISKLKEKYII